MTKNTLYCSFSEQKFQCIKIEEMYVFELNTKLGFLLEDYKREKK